jgi:hypothetical protein
LEDHLPTLTLEYSYVYHIGYDDKKHGLLIAYKTKIFELVGERTGRLGSIISLFFRAFGSALTV